LRSARVAGRSEPESSPRYSSRRESVPQDGYESRETDAGVHGVRVPELPGLEKPAKTPRAAGAQEVLPPLWETYGSQGDEVVVAIFEDLGRLREFMSEVPGELKKVTWPDWEQLRNATGVIIIFVLVVAGIIGLMDLVFRQIVDLIIRTLGG
jgi:preprotein translocase subunit SecE